MLQKKDYANSCKLKAKYNPFASRARATDVDFDDMVRIADSNRMLTKEQLYGDTLSHLTVGSYHISNFHFHTGNKFVLSKKVGKFKFLIGTVPLIVPYN